MAPGTKKPAIVIYITKHIDLHTVFFKYVRK